MPTSTERRILGAVRNLRPTTPIDHLDTALRLVRGAPCLFWGLAALSIVPLWGLILGAGWLVEGRTGLPSDGVLVAAAGLVPVVLGWRAVCCGAMIHAGLDRLYTQQIMWSSSDSSPLAEMSLRARLQQALRHLLALTIAAWLRTLVVWWVPVLGGALMLRALPGVGGMVLVAGVGIPWIATASAATWLLMPWAVLADRVSIKPRAFWASAATSVLLAMVWLMLTANITLAAVAACWLLDTVVAPGREVWLDPQSFRWDLWLSLLAFGAWIMEPWAQLAGLVVWLDDRVRCEALDIHARLDALSTARSMSAVGLLGFACVLMLATASHAQESNPPQVTQDGHLADMPDSIDTQTLRSVVSEVLSLPAFRQASLHQATPTHTGPIPNARHPSRKNARWSGDRGRVSLTQAHPNVWRVWAMLTLVAAVVAWAYWGWGMYHKRTLSTADKRPEGHDAAVPPALTSDSWRTQAEEQAAVGDLRGAIQTLYLGTVDGLSHGGWIVDGPTSTSGEILANVSRAVPNSGSWSAVEALEALTKQADKVSYGRCVVERAQFERCLVWFDQVSALGERP